MDQTVLESVGRILQQIQGTRWGRFYGCSDPVHRTCDCRKKFGTTICEPGLCPISEGLQERVMCFKTNYRDLGLAHEKIGILVDLLRSLK